MENIISTIIIPIITLVIGVVVAVEVKHSSSIKEAYQRLFKILVEVVFWAWLAFLLFSLYSLIQSKEPVTRVVVASISIHCSSIVIFLIFRIVFKLLGIIQGLHNNQVKHFDVTSNFIKGITK